MAVLERDTLGVREVRLFNAVVRWSEAECQRQQLQVTPENKRKVLGEALALIRFPLMTIEEFAAGNARGGGGGARPPGPPPASAENPATNTNVPLCAVLTGSADGAQACKDGTTTDAVCPSRVPLPVSPVPTRVCVSVPAMRGPALVHVLGGWVPALSAKG